MEVANFSTKLSIALSYLGTALLFIEVLIFPGNLLFGIPGVIFILIGLFLHYTESSVEKQKRMVKYWIQVLIGVVALVAYLVFKYFQ